MIKNFFKNLYNSAIFKRIVSLTLCFFIAVFLWFASVPCKVRADVFSAVALGTSALGALVSAYLATAGVQFSSSSDADGNFLGNYIANWVKNNPSYASNPYFNSSGEFVGSSDDVSVVQNNDTNVVSLIFGKEFAVWLEAVKQSFVSSNSLTSGASSVLTSNFLLFDSQNNQIPIIPRSSTSNQLDFTIGSSYPRYLDMNTVGSSHTFDFTNNVYITVQLTNISTYSRVLTFDINGTINQRNLSSSQSAPSLELPFFAFIYDGSSLTLNPITFQRSNGERYLIGSGYSLNSLLLDDIEEMSLGGTLTDGYQDFEDAINQDLTDADEENVAVVDVGSFPDTLTVDQIADIILDRIIADELNPTYEGIRENMQDAEEEQEGEKPFVPQYPSDWVVINGIENFFPFCIPWDLAFVFNLMQAEPEAPRFTWRMSFGKYADPYDLVIDFSKFETVAVVFRTMMVVLFLFFLIKKTRGLIRG